MKNLIDFIVSIDFKVINYFYKEHNNKTISKFFSVYTQLGKSGIYAIVIFLIMFLFDYTRKESYVVGGAILLNAIVVNIFLKNIIKRTRPFHKYPNIKAFIKWPKDYSFPSGHTAITAACTVSLFYVGYIYQLPLLFYLINIIFLILMGYSRLYLRVHFLSDVIGGFLIGTIIGCIVVLFNDKFIYLGNFLFSKFIL